MGVTSNYMGRIDVADAASQVYNTSRCDKLVVLIPVQNSLTAFPKILVGTFPDFSKAQHSKEQTLHADRISSWKLRQNGVPS